MTYPLQFFITIGERGLTIILLFIYYNYQVLLMFFKNMNERWSKYYSLLMIFAVKDLKVRYKSTFLGLFWALLVPIVTMLVSKLVLFFLKSRIPNASVYLLTGLFPWFFFNMSISTATTSLADNSNLLKKVYFNRTIIPVSIVVSNLINFLLSMVVLIILMIILKMKISLAVLFLPVLILLQIILMIGLALGFSSLFINFRDIKYGVEILLLVWFYLTPIFYLVERIRMLPVFARKLYMLNPLTNIITMYREVLINGRMPYYLMFFKTLLICLIIYIIGLIMFKKTENKFADLI